MFGHPGGRVVCPHRMRARFDGKLRESTSLCLAMLREFDGMHMAQHACVRMQLLRAAALRASVEVTVSAMTEGRHTRRLLVEVCLQATARPLLAPPWRPRSRLS